MKCGIIIRFKVGNGSEHRNVCRTLYYVTGLEDTAASSISAKPCGSHSRSSQADRFKKSDLYKNRDYRQKEYIKESYFLFMTKRSFTLKSGLGADTSP